MKWRSVSCATLFNTPCFCRRLCFPDTYHLKRTSFLTKLVDSLEHRPLPRHGQRQHGVSCVFSGRASDPRMYAVLLQRCVCPSLSGRPCALAHQRAAVSEAKRKWKFYLDGQSVSVFNPVDQCLCCLFSQFVDGDMDRGQHWDGIARKLDIVNADDGYILRDALTALLHGFHRADGGGVVGTKHGRESYVSF